MRLAEMTWRDVRDYLRRSDALVIPIGSCEQHGPHLPLSTDSLIAEAFARRVSDETGVPTAPTLASRDKGEAIFERCVAPLVECVKEGAGRS
ncbi:MAG: hypothetical protein GF400_00850 [Candidatus Eisenbacteria bacterium]|nr:hypothetical protein [Candidatus Eisenbacteria bacterium]